MCCYITFYINLRVEYVCSYIISYRTPKVRYYMYSKLYIQCLTFSIIRLVKKSKLFKKPLSGYNFRVVTELISNVCLITLQRFVYLSILKPVFVSCCSVMWKVVNRCPLSLADASKRLLSHTVAEKLLLIPCSCNCQTDIFLMGLHSTITRTPLLNEKPVTKWRRRTLADPILKN